MTAKDRATNELEHKWVKETLAEFESQHPGLLEQLSVMAAQNQVRLSIYPQMPSGGASSSTEESTMWNEEGDGDGVKP